MIGTTTFLNSIKRIVLLGVIMWSALHCSATDYYVNDSKLLGDIYCTQAGSNANSGTSSSPFATLSHVVNSIGLSSGDRVYVDAGVYNQTDITLVINVSDIEIIGAGPGITTFDNSGSSGTQEFFIEITAPASNILLSGFTITGYDYEPGSKGKAITVSGATGVVLDGINTVSNRENGDAAVMILSNSEVDILNGTSSCNQTSYGGGYQIEGINIDVSFDNCIVSQNRKTLFNGGGILITGTSGASSNVIVDIQNSSISENRASRGGGVYVEGATLTVTNSCFESNVLSATYESGGGLFVGYNATVTLTECSFLNNTANMSAADGGAIGVNAQNSSVTVQQCYFSGNTANDDGNAIWVDRAYSSSTAVVLVNESIFETSPAQNSFRKSDASLTITNSGVRQPDSGSSTIGGNDNPQTLGAPTTNCPYTATPCQTVLPVELLRFNGVCRKHDNLLQFTTVSEKQNDYFIIEKLYNNTMVEIGVVDAVGDSDSEVHYEFIDREVDGEDSYYRLIQVDQNGKFEILSTISVRANCSNESDIVSVVLVNDALRIHYSIERDDNYQLMVSDMTGKIIVDSELELLSEHSSRLSPIRTPLATGCYLVRLLNSKGDEFNSRVVVGP